MSLCPAVSGARSAFTCASATSCTPHTFMPTAGTAGIAPSKMRLAIAVELPGKRALFI